MKKLSLPLLADTVITRRKGAKMTQAELLSADLSSLPTIILRRFLFTNDPAYLLLSVALGDVFLLPPPFALRYPVHVA